MPNWRFNADNNASHHCRLTCALGLFKETLWQLFEYWLFICRASLKGPAETGNVLGHRSSSHGLIGPPVHKAVGGLLCCAKVPCALALLGCPSTGGQRTERRRQSATRDLQAGALSFGSPRPLRAVARHAAGSIPQSWLAPPLLGFSRKVG